MSAAALALASMPQPCPATDTAGETVAAAALSVRRDDERVHRGIEMIYRLQFEAAEQHFGAIAAAAPDHPLGYFFLAMVSWWRVLLDLDDRSHDEAFYARLEECIDVCDARLKIDRDDFDAVFFKGGAIGFRGRLRGDRDQFLRAARDGLRCLPLLKRSRKLDPDNKDALFGQGLYNYFAEVMPGKYPVIRHLAWLLVRGDRELGLQQLQEAAAEGRYARTEARYFLAQIYRLFEDDAETALTHLDVLRRTYPENALFHRFTARAQAELGRWQRAVPLYSEVIERARAGGRGYHLRSRVEARYYLGKHAFLQHRLAAAAVHFGVADSLGRTLGADLNGQSVRKYVILVNLYLGMIRDELGQRDAALRQYARVRELPDHGDSHRLARQFQKTPYSSGRGAAVGTTDKAHK